MYQPICKQQQLIIGTGKIAIATGWTPKETIAKQLDPSEYAAIGNLYSPTRGISPLIRNLLANPHVRELVVLEATKADKNAQAITAIADLYANGFTKGVSDTGRDCWIINSDVTAYIDIEIPSIVIKLLLEKVALWKTTTIHQCVKQVKDLNDFYQKEPTMFPTWGEPLFYPEPEAIATVYPGARYGHRIEGKTIAETWVKILHRIKTTGTIRPTEYGQWQELIDLVAIVTNEPEGFYFPEPNYLPINPESLPDYISQVLEDAPYTEGVKYTYGQRLRSWFGKNQIEQVIQKLVAEPNSAQAVMSLWDSGSGGWSGDIERKPDFLKIPYREDIARFGRDRGDSDHDHDSPPCLNHIWVRIVDGELSLTATFRSNDMFGAWPANAMGLRALQEHIKSEVEARSQSFLSLGPLITISQSAHIYSDTWDNVEKLIANQYPSILKNKSYADPCGNFLITVDQEKKLILVDWITPGLSGELIKTFKGKNAPRLADAIAADCPQIESSHAIYLGMELHKAEAAMMLNMTYNQGARLLHGNSYHAEAK